MKKPKRIPCVKCGSENTIQLGEIIEVTKRGKMLYVIHGQKCEDCGDLYQYPEMTLEE